MNRIIKEVLQRLKTPAFAIYYIGGSDVLPAPLKGEQEQQALEELEQGDENAKKLLIERDRKSVV